MSSWALVTGATSGIGESFTRLLASKKYNIVLVARDLPRLQEKATALEARYGIKTQVIQADLATDEGCLRVEKHILENQVDVLINNAGFGTNKAFTMSTLEVEQQLLDVLVRTPMRLMHVALPLMKARDNGIIINVSSVAGYIAGGTYSASKSYLTVLTESLHTELAATNVKVSALCPGFTRTEFHQRGKMSMKGLPEFLWLNSDRLVEQSWRDAIKGKAVSVPGWQYKLLVFIVQTLVPRSIVRKIGMNMRDKQRK
jgi:short-subunit dehydrogenase